MEPDTYQLPLFYLIAGDQSHISERRARLDLLLDWLPTWMLFDHLYQAHPLWFDVTKILPQFPIYRHPKHRDPINLVFNHSNRPLVSVPLCTLVVDVSFCRNMDNGQDLVNCGAWWFIGKFCALCPEGRRFESHSRDHEGILGKFFTHSCLKHFSMLTPTQYQCCS